MTPFLHISRSKFLAPPNIFGNRKYEIDFDIFSCDQNFLEHWGIEPTRTM